jgi:hypothetical protein
MSSVTVPFPVPVAPEATLIQPTFDAAVQSHAAPVATSTLADEAGAPTETPTFDSATVQLLPAWTTETSRPAAVIAPVRENPLTFWATLNVTVPFPSPDPPEAIVIHGVLVVAVQPQPAAPVTFRDALVAAADKDTAVGATLSVHATPAWVTLTVCPAIVKVPVRGAVPVWAATLKVTVPPPLPLAPPVTVIHGSALLAVHPQPLPAYT